MNLEADPEGLAKLSVQESEWRSWALHRRRIFLLVFVAATAMVAGLTVFALLPLHTELSRQRLDAAQVILDQSSRVFDARTKALLHRAERLAADVELNDALAAVDDNPRRLEKRLHQLLGDSVEVVGLVVLAIYGQPLSSAGQVPVDAEQGLPTIQLRPIKLVMDEVGLMFTLALHKEGGRTQTWLQVIFDASPFRKILLSDVSGNPSPLLVWNDQVFLGSIAVKRQLQACGGFAHLLASRCGSAVKVLEHPLEGADWSLALLWDKGKDRAYFMRALGWLPFGLLVIAVGLVVLTLVVLRPLDRLFMRAEHLYELSARDELTGLNNRRHLMSALDKELARAARHRLALNVLLLDIDRFKPINDTYGHAVGDQAIKEVAKAVERMSRSEDVTARLGGDEFVVVQSDVDLAGAVRFAERLRKTISRIQINANGNWVNLSVSIGVAHVAAEFAAQVPRERALHIADRALYKAKAAGRNKVAARGVREQPSHDAADNS